MKKQALEKLMMVLDEILGEDVKGRMGKEEAPADETPAHETAEGPVAENVEDTLEKALGKEISAYESVTEARGAKLIQREYDKTVGEIEDTLESYKKAKGTPKAAGFVSKLKELNARKKSLETELDTKISGLYKSAALKMESVKSNKN